MFGVTGDRKGRREEGREGLQNELILLSLGLGPTRRPVNCLIT